ncbi:hypothetical protein PoB_005507500 [Plakobranchus ocellatus]|uniref:Uncharacterized protein n=1 Tax=Plakobranchus ocellatus TaxID=259542 RepID=A0AAV4C780_9GAST|nr:hypothetical protein PoB_005507500 [Plakobranchus ocellatus]
MLDTRQTALESTLAQLLPDLHRRYLNLASRHVSFTDSASPRNFVDRTRTRTRTGARLCRLRPFSCSQWQNLFFKKST